MTKLTTLAKVGVGSLWIRSFGVDLFFTLSAYLITELLMRERQRCGAIDVARSISGARYAFGRFTSAHYSSHPLVRFSFHNSPVCEYACRGFSCSRGILRASEPFP